jgi:hypothetical protein
MKKILVLFIFLIVATTLKAQTVTLSDTTIQGLRYTTTWNGDILFKATDSTVTGFFTSFIVIESNNDTLVIRKT